MTEARFEMDERGFHRIVVGGAESRWTGYAQVSTLEVDGVLHIGCSAYWEGTLPIERVLTITELDSERREVRRQPAEPLNTGQSLAGTGG